MNTGLRCLSFLVLALILGVAYNRVAHNEHDSVRNPLQVTLREEEKEALRNERDKLFSERDIMKVTVVVCMAAFLQGHVQASFNSSSLFPAHLGAVSITGSHKLQSIVEDERNATSHNIPALDGTALNADASNTDTSIETWALGGLNAIPWFTAALLGCSLAPIVNNIFGRKGAIAISASLILISSIASSLIPLVRYPDIDTWNQRWWILFSFRIINGIG